MSAAEPERPAFAPGMRFSMLDGCVLALAAVAAGIASIYAWWIALVIGLTVGHFYLFCKVFRISRTLELVWAAAFLLLAIGTIIAEIPGWLLTTVIAAIVSVWVIVIEMRRPSYHGIGWEIINPSLPEWWAAQASRTSDETRS